MVAVTLGMLLTNYSCTQLDRRCSLLHHANQASLNRFPRPRRIPQMSRYLGLGQLAAVSCPHTLELLACCLYLRSSRTLHCCRNTAFSAPEVALTGPPPALICVTLCGWMCAEPDLCTLPRFRRFTTCRTLGSLYDERHPPREAYDSVHNDRCSSPRECELVAAKPDGLGLVADLAAALAYCRCLAAFEVDHFPYGTTSSHMRLRSSGGRFEKVFFLGDCSIVMFKLKRGNNRTVGFRTVAERYMVI